MPSFISKHASLVRATLTLCVLFIAAVSVATGQFATTQATPTSNPVLPQAQPYSYVFLDPLEGQHTAAKEGNHLNVEMHGHWVIDVRNQDGTLAQHRDFENTIQGGGAAYLIGLMAGYVVPSDYEIFLSSTGTTPCTPPGTLQGCTIVRSLTSSPGSNTCPSYFCVTGLTYTYNQSYSVTTSNSFVLAGTFTANRAGTIDNVQTYAGSCPVAAIETTLATVSPATCNASVGGVGINALSGAAITSVPVVSSQIVQVTVTISFS
jgi:hypothetical protein